MELLLTYRRVPSVYNWILQCFVVCLGGKGNFCSLFILASSSAVSSSNSRELISLACFSCEHFFNFFMSCEQANLFCEESLEKIDAIDVERLKAMITLKQVNTSVKTSMVTL